MFIFRVGLPVEVPADYASLPAHRALVDRLTTTNRYTDVLGILEANAVSWLAADVLLGAEWAQRFLNTTARLSQSSVPGDRRLAAAGQRALMHVLAGKKPHIGRTRAEPLSPEDVAKGSAAIARWRARVDACWRPEQPTLTAGLLEASASTFQLSAAHRRALRALLRRRGIRRIDVALTLASWETGIAVRRLRQARPVADLVYG